mgnify:FL=1
MSTTIDIVRFCFFSLILILNLSACTQTTDPLEAFESGDFETAYQLWLPRA